MRQPRRDRPPVEYREHTGKVCYDKRGALTAKNARFKQSHAKLRVYDCPHCGYWHLTSWPSFKKIYN